MSRMKRCILASADVPRLSRASDRLSSSCHSSDKIQWNPMEDTDLQALMARLELLINRLRKRPGARNALTSLKKTKSPGVRSNR
eukprot:gene1683-1949_t